jgi:hypothetical protein
MMKELNRYILPVTVKRQLQGNFKIRHLTGFFTFAISGHEQRSTSDFFYILHRHGYYSLLLFFKLLIFLLYYSRNK